MNRRIWTGIVAGVLAAALLLTVGVGAYQAGRDDATVTRVGDGEVVRVVGDHWRGPGFGFFLFPLFIILLVVLLARGAFWRGRWYRHYGGWGGPGPWGYGPPGPYGSDPDRPDDPSRPASPERRFDEWHRRSHERGVPSGTGTETGSERSEPSAPGPSEPPTATPQDTVPPGRSDG